MLEKPKQQLRKVFIQTIESLMVNDEKVILIYGDVGFSFMEPIIEKYPNQTLNAGIAEQNMMTMAAGMAREGWKPYVYTMSNFILLRPLEQVRNDIAFANANVKLFGVKGGASYAFLGMSHNLFEGEEKGMVKFLPNMNSYFLETEKEVEDAMKMEYNREGPAYFSL